MSNYPGLAHEAIHRFDKLCHGGVSQTWYQSARLAVDYPSTESSAILCSIKMPDGFYPSPSKKHGYCRTIVWCCRTVLSQTSSPISSMRWNRRYPIDMRPYPIHQNIPHPRMLTMEIQLSREARFHLGIPSSYLAHHLVDSRS